MEKGSYWCRLNLADYVAHCFRPYLFGDERRGRYGCGASALSLITGVLPEDVSRQNNGAHYADEFMTRFLRGHGFRVQALTQSNIAAASSKIEHRHVILLSQMFRQREATWGVIYNSMYYHNFQIHFLDTLTLIRKPIVSAYLVVHPTWRNCSMEWQDEPPKLKTAGSGLSLRALGLTRKRAARYSNKY